MRGKIMLLIVGLLLGAVLTPARAADLHPTKHVTQTRSQRSNLPWTQSYRDPSSPDNWLGGNGNWSNGSDWSAGLPGSGNDVNINTGNDTVTLDTSSSINSLTLGGSTGSSGLAGDGTAHTLTIAGALTVNQSGNLHLNDDSASAGASSTNLGTTSVEFGSSLGVHGDFNNAGTLNVGQSQFSFGNSANITGTLTNTGRIGIGYYALTSGGSGTVTAGGLNNSGTINLGFSGSSLQVNGSAMNSGAINLDFGTIFSVAGDMNNSGQLGISADDNGINGSISVAGTLTNTSTGVVSIQGVVSSGHAGTLINQGSLFVGADLATSASFSAGTITNSGTIAFGSYGIDSLTVSGVLTNTSTGVMSLYDDDASLSAGTLVNQGSITFGSGDTQGSFRFTVSGSAQNSGSIVASSFGQLHTGDLNNSGSIQLNAGSSLQVSGDVTNSGSLTTANGVFNNSVSITGKLTNTASGTFALGYSGDTGNIGYVNNAGTLSLVSGTTLNVIGGSHAPKNALPGFVNSGSFNIASGATYSSPLSFSQTGGETTVDGAMRVNGRGFINFSGGEVYGNGGTIEGPITSNAYINIGDAPNMVGAMTFMGNYTQGPNGTLAFDIAGPASGQYDRLNVSGHAQFNGTMIVNLLNGYIPQLNNTFDIMNFASSSGAFSMVLGLPINGQEHFVLEYNSTDLTLDVVSGQLQGASYNGSSEPFISSGGGNAYNLTATNDSPASPTPEPGTLLLLASGAMGIAGIRARRRGV